MILSTAKLNNEVIIRTDNDINFKQIYSLLDDVKDLYPCFSSWLHFKFRRNISNGTRKIISAHKDGQLVGVSLLKKTEQKNKICTFYVHPEYRNLGIGQKLIEASINEFSQNEILITVSEERNDYLKDFLRGFG